MHKSRLGTIVIDCQTERLDDAAAFWSAALGRSAARFDDPNVANYRDLTGPDSEVKVLVQAVSHPSRVHIDIESDDVEAEVGRLEALGARRVSFVKTWWVMEAPSGHYFCVVPVQSDDFLAQAHVWDAEISR